jgi:hypothetical protein
MGAYMWLYMLVFLLITLHSVITHFILIHGENIDIALS